MKRNILKVLMVVCALVFTFSAYKIVTYYYESYQSEKDFSSLASQIKKEEGGKKLLFYERYEELLKLNPDMVGWIKIEDTKIDYPVMLTPNDEEFYLRKNFYKEYEFRGTPFLNKDANIKDEDTNMIIYAHNMDDGTMFGGLRKLTSYSFYETHKTFTFETLYHSNEYEIVTVFKTVDNPQSELFVDYYNFKNPTEDEFYAQFKRYRELQYYDTGVEVQFGDKLLTLSTCEYSNENGRLVVVARKVDQ